MTLKTNKGYSLIEIGVGIIIITVFLLFSIALFNGCYNTYRRMNQRTIAMDDAVRNMEAVLQSDSAVLTGFFEDNRTVIDGVSVVKATPTASFEAFIRSNFEKYKTRYSNIMNVDVDHASLDYITDSEFMEYVIADKNYLINRYLEDNASSYTTEQYAKGTYGFIPGMTDTNYGLGGPNVIELGNKVLLGYTSAEQSDLFPTNNNSTGIRRTVTRIPSDGKTAYGNNVLLVKVEVFYTRKLDYRNLTPDDIESITLETLKIEN